MEYKYRWWSERIKLFTLIAVLLFFTSSAAYAIDLNGYRLIPSLTLSETFDDNYFLVNDDIAGVRADEAWVTTVTPDIRLEAGEINKLALGFKSDLILVEGLDPENRQNQTYTASFDYNPGERLSLKIEDTLRDVKDQGSTRPVAGEIERTIRVENDLQSTLTYRFTEKMGSEAILRWSTYDFDVFNQQLTRHEYYITLRGTYFIFPRTQAFVGYRYSDFVYTGLKFILEEELARGRTAGELDMDNQAHNVQAGLKFQQLPVGGGRLQGEVWAGYERIDFERQSDQDVIVLEGRLTYLPTPRTNVALRARREHAASALVSGTNTINSSVRLDVIYRFYEKFQGSFGVGYRISDYQEPAAIRGDRAEREDDTITFRAGLRYNFYKYFTAGIRYDFTDKSVDPVDLRSREYQQSKVTFTLNATF